jgi:SOS response regulatory protein OraA/RecX
MPTVKYIKPQKSGRVIIGVDKDGEMSNYSISAGDYAAASFVTGGILSDEEFSLLVTLDEEYRAIKKALSLLSYSDKNKKAIYMRLVRLGFSREAAKKAVEYCLVNGFINEEKQLERLVCNEANVNLRGPRYIADKLAAKGYSRADVEAAIDTLVEAGEIDFVINFDTLCEKKSATTPEERKALAYKYGFRGV